MMSRSFSRVCLTAVLSFIVGFLCSPVVIGLWKGQFVAPVELQRYKEAHAFFYKTMIELFEGTYNSEDGYISQKPHDIPNIYKEYAERLGGKCVVHLEKDSLDDFVGQAFFPSGDVFDVTVARIDGRWKLVDFHHWNWNRLWADRLDLYDVSDTRQRSAEEH